MKRIRPAHHYQRKDAPIRLLAEEARPKVRRDLKSAFVHLSEMVPVREVATSIMVGRHPAALIHWNQYREILKVPFNRLAKLHEAAAALGVRKINGAFAQAQRRVRFGKEAGHDVTDELRDERGRWTAGGMPSAENDSARPVYLRVGAWNPKSERSSNFARGTVEDGLSVYDLSNGSPVVPAESEWAADDLNDRLQSDVPKYLVQGDLVGEGGDGEPLLRNVRVVGMYAPVKKDIGGRFNFDTLSPQTQASLRAAQDALIQQLESDARDTINTIIIEGTRYGLDADAMAIRIREMIGLTSTQAQAVMNYQRMLYDLDPEALTRQLRNVEYDAAFQDAIDSGVDLADVAIERMVGDYVENYLDYRANAIAKTESVRASAEGLHDSYSQAIERGALPDEAVRRFWKIDLTEGTCPVCLSIPDLNPDGVGVDELFDSIDGPADDPPLHPHCACSVEYVTDLTKIPDEEDQAAA